LYAHPSKVQHAQAIATKAKEQAIAYRRSTIVNANGDHDGRTTIRSTLAWLALLRLALQRSSVRAFVTSIALGRTQPPSDPDIVDAREDDMIGAPETRPRLLDLRMTVSAVGASFRF
jgi:hypothetical protein